MLRIRYGSGLIALTLVVLLAWTIPASNAQVRIALTPTALAPTVFTVTQGIYIPLVLQAGALASATSVATVAPSPTITASRTPTISTTPATPTSNAPTRTPTLPPATFRDCQQDPQPNAAPNYPVAIVAIDKGAETVTLHNGSTNPVDLTGWHMCSILGNQEHPIAGTLAPGAQQTFPGPASNIWNNSQRDDGALYNDQGQLVSYFTDSNSTRNEP